MMTDEQELDALRRFTVNVEKHLAKIRPVRREMEKAGHDDLVVIANLVQFIELFTLDFTFISMDHTRQNHKWGRGLYGRILSLMIVECFDDFGALLGKRLRSTITSLEYDPSVLATLDSIRRELKQLVVKHDADLRAIRNNVFGHRDHDATLQLEVMDTLDIASIVKIREDLMRWLLKLQDFVGAVTAPLPGHVKSRRLQMNR